ncbi:MAG: tyrosine-type recombinase/integrase [Bacteroidales bacterium]|jgi:site-specific recombinase XerD
MARFTIQLDKRRELYNGLYNLVVRVNIGNDMVYLNIAKLTEQQYDHVFIKRVGDEESITFREKCEELRTKSERDFNKIKPFNKKRFRELFYEKEKKVPDSLVLKDLFKDYITTFEYIKHNTRIRYRTTGNVFDTFRPGMTVYDITPNLLRDFEKFKLKEKRTPATIASYMIDLRRILNYYTKVRKLIPSTFEYPFGEGKYKIKKSKPPKDALENEEIKSVVEMKDFDSPKEEYARDIWLMLYRCNGSNYADLLRMRWENVKKECIIFYRKKTETTQIINKKPVIVPLTKGVQELLDKIGHKDSPFVLGKLKEGYSETTFDNKSDKERRILNLYLRGIERKLQLSALLRLETARDCYASCLDRAGIATKKISNMMAHSSVTITEEYLASMNYKELFYVNSVLL